MKEQMETLPFSPPLSLIETGKWLLAVTSFECRNSVFKITDENKGFSITVPGRWKILDYIEDGMIDKLKILLKLKSHNDIGLHVEKVEKRGNQIQIGDKEYKLSDFDSFRTEILENLKKPIIMRLNMW